MWPRKNIAEIAADPVLRLYGALLALPHALAFWFWHVSYDLETVLGPGAEPICWPFWEDCWRWRFHDMAQLRMVLWSYFALSLVPLLLFTRQRWTTAAWWSLLLVNVVQLAIVAQDFQLRMNQVYMTAFTSLAFLLVPGKRNTLRALIVLFYVFAGLLKLNYEWLSGAAIDKPIWFFTGAREPIAATYVVVLELVLVWGLFSRRPWLFWVTLAQLILFQIASWQVVGYYYPLMMFALLAIFPLTRLRPNPPAPRLSAPFLAAFCLLQCVPLLYPGESALTGEGRMFAIHMFDAAVECEPYALLTRLDGSTERRDLTRPLPRRIRCDPLVFFNRARALCRSPERGTAFTDFDLHLNARKSTDAAMRPIVALRDVCATNPTYDVWRHNRWINP